MTHGPKPGKAIECARGIAMRRGTVWDVSSMPGFPAHLLVFTPKQVVFIRVKRTRSHISDVGEVRLANRLEIFGLRNIPATAVISTELWILSPWGTWQYFRINPDSVSEIQCDGLAVVHVDPVTRQGTSPVGPVSIIPPVTTMNTTGPAREVSPLVRGDSPGHAPEVPVMKPGDNSGDAVLLETPARTEV